MSVAARIVYSRKFEWEQDGGQMLSVDGVQISLPTGCKHTPGYIYIDRSDGAYSVYYGLKDVIPQVWNLKICEAQDDWLWTSSDGKKEKPRFLDGAVPGELKLVVITGRSARLGHRRS